MYSGQYKERDEYYSKLDVTGNVYLDIYKNVREMYEEYHKWGIRFFDDANHTRDYEISLAKIRDTQGFGRAWGFANVVLEIISDWRGYITEVKSTVPSEESINEDFIMIEAEKTSANLSNTLDSLYNSILEVLPAFVEWKRTAIVPENQPIVDFLHERSNNYRRVGDPKYYAYDNVVDVFVKTDIIINSENCKYFK